MSPIKHLIFDCDGVLIDSEYLAVQVMLRMLKPFGYVSDFRQFSNRFTGMLDTEILKHIQKEHSIAFPKDFYRQVELERDRAFAEDLSPIAGMPQLVRALPIRKSVVSNSHVAHVVKALDLCELSPQFEDRIYSSEHVQHPKPHPDVYEFALKAQNLSATEVVVVEDSLTGVRAARGAGCRVIGFLGGKHISNGHGQQLKDLGADQVASSAEELQDILKGYL